MTDRPASSRTTGPRRVGQRRAPLALIVAMLRELVDPYRPELHYMRGPGPKWHAKHRAPRVEAPADGRLLPA